MTPQEILNQLQRCSGNWRQEAMQYILSNDFELDEILDLIFEAMKKKEKVDFPSEISAFTKNFCVIKKTMTDQYFKVTPCSESDFNEAKNSSNDSNNNSEDEEYIPEGYWVNSEGILIPHDKPNLSEISSQNSDQVSKERNLEDYLKAALKTKKA